jgi:hypothetical protein
LGAVYTETAEAYHQLVQGNGARNHFKNGANPKSHTSRKIKTGRTITMAQMQFTGVSYSYIFDGAGGMRDQLEQTTLVELETKKYPLKATIKQVKAGGMFFGTKEQCVVIEVDKEAQITISNTTVGDYLYVEIYLMVQEKNSLFAAISALADNVFKQQKRNAVLVAAKEATESAFAKLGLKQSNSGYKGARKETTSEE